MDSFGRSLVLAAPVFLILARWLRTRRAIVYTSMLVQPTWLIAFDRIF